MINAVIMEVLTVLWQRYVSPPTAAPPSSPLSSYPHILSYSYHAYQTVGELLQNN